MESEELVYLYINYPKVLIVTQLVNSSIGLIMVGVIISFAWLKWPALLMEA